MNAAEFEIVTTLLLVATGALIAITDILTRRIPNWQVAIVLVLSVLHVAIEGGWWAVASAFSHGLVTLIIGAALFHWKVIGGGDAKFYAAVASGVTWSGALDLLWWTSIGGLGMMVILFVPLLRNRLSPKSDRFSVPFGVAIFAGLAGVSVSPLG